MWSGVEVVNIPHIQYIASVAVKEQIAPKSLNVIFHKNKKTHPLYMTPTFV